MQWYRLSNEQQDELFKNEHQIVLHYFSKKISLGPPMVQIRYIYGRSGDPIYYPTIARVEFALIQPEGRLAMRESLGSMTDLVPQSFV